MQSTLAWTEGQEVLDFGGTLDDKAVLLNHGFLFGLPNTTQITITFNASVHLDWTEHCVDHDDHELNTWKASAMAINSPGEEFTFVSASASPPTPDEKHGDQHWAATVQQGIPKELLFVLRIQLLERSEFEKAPNAFDWSPVSLQNEKRVANYLERIVRGLLDAYPGGGSCATDGEPGVDLAQQLVQAEKRLLGEVLNVIKAMPGSFAANM